MARAGIPIPAEAQARVDLFNPVLADIGDLQSVTGDLSTFSGHLVVRVWYRRSGEGMPSVALSSLAVLFRATTPFAAACALGCGMMQDTKRVEWYRTISPLVSNRWLPPFPGRPGREGCAERGEGRIAGPDG